MHPAWLLIPLGLALSAVIGLFQGTFQSTTFALALAGMGLALLWLGLVVAKPEVALLLYTLLAVNLNSINLPLPLGGVRVSPDIVLVSLLIVGVLLRLLATRRPPVSLPISAPYLVFLAVPIITLLWSPTVVESVRGIFRFVGYFALMWLIVDTIRTKAQVRHMVVAIILSTIIPIVSGFYQAVTGSGQFIWAGAAFNRIYGFAGGPFTLAFYLVMVMPLVLIVFLAQRDDEQAEPGVRLGQEIVNQPGAADLSSADSWRFNRLGLGLLLGLIGAALLLTFIRGAWIALVVSLLALGAMRGSLRFRQLVFTIPAAAGVVLLTFTPALERLQQVADPTSTLFGRVEVWRLALDWLLASPLNLLAGVGMKAFEYYYILLAGPTTAGLYWRRESFLIGNRPHNELLGFLLDVGVIGTIALLAVLYILARLAVRIYRHSQDHELRLVALAFLIGFVGLVVGAMGDNVFSQPSVTVYFWIMAGLVMAIDRHLLPPAQENPGP
ncbi:MAG TPA: O-antigen ligase family protein [Anaerolineae bacterium]|nr:O-antigen ligase family protein [Anaerolineae bacterium]